MNYFLDSLQDRLNKLTEKGRNITDLAISPNRKFVAVVLDERTLVLYKLIDSKVHNGQPELKPIKRRETSLWEKIKNIALQNNYIVYIETKAKLGFSSFPDYFLKNTPLRAYVRYRSGFEHNTERLIRFDYCIGEAYPNSLFVLNNNGEYLSSVTCNLLTTREQSQMNWQIRSLRLLEQSNNGQTRPLINSPVQTDPLVNVPLRPPSPFKYVCSLCLSCNNDNSRVLFVCDDNKDAIAYIKRNTELRRLTKCGYKKSIIAIAAKWHPEYPEILAMSVCTKEHGRKICKVYVVNADLIRDTTFVRLHNYQCGGGYTRLEWIISNGDHRILLYNARGNCKSLKLAYRRGVPCDAQGNCKVYPLARDIDLPERIKYLKNKEEEHNIKFQQVKIHEKSISIPGIFNHWHRKNHN